ncbi:MAG: hypothetical protein WBY24_16680 [Candidatus Acidiferrales bacterium]
MKIFAACALLGAGYVAFPACLRAQAGPGPMRPPEASADTTQPAAGPAARVEEPAVPQRKQLFGFWRLNVDDSDDAHEKMKEASNEGNVSSPRGGGGGNGGGGNGNGTGIHLGGMGSPFPGGGGGNGGGGSSRRNGNSGSDSELDRVQMQELLNPAGSLTLALKDPTAAAAGSGPNDAKDASAAKSEAAPKDPNDEEILVTDDLGRERVYYTDGRKVPKPKDEKYQEFDAYWVESYRLVAEYDGSRGARVTRSFEPAPGGKQLYEIVRLERTRSYGPVEIRYVYDLSQEHKVLETK